MTPVKRLKTIGDLQVTHRNPRVHGERNIAQLERSLERFGAARSIVVDENGEIICGKGLVEAAANIGIKKIIPIETDGNSIVAVVRKGLSEKEKRALDVADNRAAELAEWDPEVMLELQSDVDLSDFFFPNELEKMMAVLESNAEELEKGSVPELEKGTAQSEKEPDLSANQGMTVPLYLVLSRQQYNKWREIKKALDVKSDMEAFLKLAGIE